MSYHRHYKLKDDRFGLLALTLREKAGLTQTEVAAVLGVSERTIRHWEGGTAFPNAHHMKQLIELYLRHEAFVSGHERDEAKAFWEQAAQSASHHKALFDEAWFDLLLKRHRASPQHGEPAQTSALSPPPPLPRRADWGEEVDVTAFYGREPELATLEQWVLRDRCRLVVVLSMGGFGKTTLSARFAHKVAPDFEFVFWRSLRNAPPLEEVLADCLQTLSEQQSSSLPQSIENSTTLLIDLLQKRRCLLVLDNVDTLLQAGSFEGRYREGYEGYRLFIQRVAETPHQSCLLLTSREMPGELEPLEGRQSPVRVLKLFGLGRVESQGMLQDKELFGTQEAWDVLVGHYAGNPLALKLSAATVREVFGGNIASFLRGGPMILHTLRQLLDYQFERLSPLERDLMFWLAIERDLVSLEEVSRDLLGAVPKREVLDALKSLRWRCLIERAEQEAIFTLQAVVLEYVSERLVEHVCDEIIRGTPVLFLKYALMKAQSTDHIRDSQVRMLMQPLLERLLTHFGGEQELEQHLMLLVQQLRERPSAAQVYGGGNLLNLLACLRGHIRGADFSHLLIRQAYLQETEAQDASLAESDITDSLFMNPNASIASMALSPDGNHLAVGGFSGQIRLWHVADGQPLLTFRGHSRMAWALSFSRDSRILASCGYDRSVKLWQVGGEGSGRCIRILPGHDKWVRGVAFSPDGTLLATSGDDETVRLWDVQEGTCLRILHGHIGTVWAVAFSPDGTLLATSGDDETVRLWDVQERTCLRILHGHTGEIMAVAFHPGGNVFASGGEDGLINIWDVRSGLILSTLQLRATRAMSIAFSPEGTMLASGSYDGGVEVWKIEGESGNYRIRTLQGHPTFVSAVAFGPGGLLASASYGGKVKLWDVESGKRLRTFQGYSSEVRSVSFNPDGSLLVHGDDNGVLRVWEVGKEGRGRCLRTFKGHAGHIWSVIWSSDGKTVASGGDDQSIKLWEVGSWRCLKTFHGQTTVVWSLAFSPDDSLLASGNFNRTVKLWGRGREDGEDCLKTLHGHEAIVWSVAFSPDGSLLASGDNDGEIKLWEVESGQCLKTLQHGASPVGALVFSADGSTLISSSNDESVCLWEVGSGRCLKSLPGRGLVNWVRAMAFSRDGKLLATGNNDHSVTLWHVEEQGRTQYLQTFAKQDVQVWSVAFGFDGSLLASGDDDGTIIVWDTQTGTSLQTLHTDRPYERMNIRGAKGLTEAQKASLKTLGAIEDAVSKTSVSFVQSETES